MICGIVNARHQAFARLKLRGPTGVESELNFLIDTGFSSALALPHTTVQTLGLVRQSTAKARLADGSVRPLELFAAEVEWCGVWQAVVVSDMGDEPILGMQVLVGHALRVEVTDGGTVEISPLP